MSSDYYQEYLRVEAQVLHPLQREVLGPNDLECFYNGVRRASNADIEGLNPKLDWIRRHLLRFNSRKMVIFSPFISLGVRQLEQVVADFDVRPRVAVIEGDSTEAERQAAIDEYNANEVQVLLVSVLAGGPGINLLETRDVIVMQPGWNEVETQQEVGRAIRFRSHERLPPAERRVDVRRLLLAKPPGAGGRPAADRVIEGIARKKDLLIRPFLAALRGASIEAGLAPATP
jgi:hypothetical protein